MKGGVRYRVLVEIAKVEQIQILISLPLQVNDNVWVVGLKRELRARVIVVAEQGEVLTPRHALASCVLEGSICVYVSRRLLGGLLVAVLVVLVLLIDKNDGLPSYDGELFVLVKFE